MAGIFDAEALTWIGILIAIIWPCIKIFCAMGRYEHDNRIKDLTRYDSEAALAKDCRRYGKDYRYYGHI